MKSGTAIAVGLGALAAVALAFGMYVNTFAYYERVEGVAAVDIGGRAFAVSEYDGLDNEALPLRLRGCFRLEDPAGALSAGAEAAEPAPFDAPFWFDCWDAAAIDADLQAGRATAVVAAVSGEGQFRRERLVAIYPDGRAFMWRRFREID